MTSKHLDEDIYQQALAESVHHSLKITNSNIKGGGIRVSNSAHLDLPYISVRTLLNENIWKENTRFQDHYQLHLRN